MFAIKKAEGAPRDGKGGARATDMGRTREWNGKAWELPQDTRGRPSRAGLSIGR